MRNGPAPHFYRRCWRTRLARRSCRKRTSSPTFSPPISGPRSSATRRASSIRRTIAFGPSFAPLRSGTSADITAGAKPGTLVLKDPNFVQVAGRGGGPVSSGPSGRLPAGSPRHRRVLRADRAEADATKPSKYEKRDIRFISKKILASYQPLLAAVPASVVIVRYEELASDPKGCLHALARDTGLTLSLDRIETPAGWTLKPATRRLGSASWRAEAFAGQHRIVPAGVAWR